jgi:hypothetical protein
VNRTIAGVHFPVDSAAGQLLGLTLGEYFVARCLGAPRYTSWRFDGRNYIGANDFDWRLLFDTTGVNPHRVNNAPYATLVGNEPSQGSAMLRWLWNHAVAEWP